jgi:CheY-like chemotaxis protein
LPAARRVLIVDDHVDSADIIAEALETEGHETRVAYNPLSAMAIAAEFRPDVAILDVNLPSMDGYELGAALRADLSECRFIALTGDATGLSCLRRLSWLLEQAGWLGRAVGRGFRGTTERNVRARSEGRHAPPRTDAPAPTRPGSDRPARVARGGSVLDNCAALHRSRAARRSGRSRRQLGRRSPSPKAVTFPSSSYAAQRCCAAYARQGRQLSARASTSSAFGRCPCSSANARITPRSEAGNASGSRS